MSKDCFENSRVLVSVLSSYGRIFIEFLGILRVCLVRISILV